MDRKEYMCIPIKLIPPDFIEEYQLCRKVHREHVYLEINKGMYGLLQAGKLTNTLLKKRLATCGYLECLHTPGLWRHMFRPIQFTLVVDDFGIKFVGVKHLKHPIESLQKFFEIDVHKKGTKYCRITLEWDYENCTIDISMPNYVCLNLVF